MRLKYGVLSALFAIAFAFPLFAQTPPQPSAAATSAATAPAGKEDLSYRLGAGDKLRVTTFGEDELTGEFLVGGNGAVSLPLVGDVTAGGLTVDEFRTKVVEALKKGYILDPKVSVEVLTYRPFYVLGEVNKPGEYPYVSGLNVINAVATASGFTYRANTKHVFIRHQDEDKEREYPMSGSTLIHPGDTIRVKERYF